MLPVKVCDSQNCLEKLVGVRSDCENGNCSDFYIEDIEGVDLKSLAEIANINSPSGVTVAKDLINTASREMLGDLELLIGNGYSIKETFDKLCSTCTYLTSYANNAGISVNSTVVTKYGVLRVHSLQALTNYTGKAAILINDGKATKSFPVDLVAGEIGVFTLSYETLEKSVKITFDNPAIGSAKINCPSTSTGCGCGGSASRSAANTIRFQGLVGGQSAPNQYGFIACASIGCSNDAMICDLISQTPKLFALTLLYKVGAKYYSSARLSKRNNRTAGQEDEEKIDMQAYYSKLYGTRLTGTAINKGLYGIISNYLKQKNDKCVSCDGKNKQGWAAG